MALIRLSKVGVADALPEGRSPASGRANRANIMLARNSFGRGRTRAGASKVPFDPHPRLIDQMHVVHARRAGGHAGQAGETAIDVLDDFRRRRAVLFQHLLDEIDSAARTIEFVAEQDVGRTGRGTEAAMHALAQDRVGFGDIGVGQLRQAEFGLHAVDPEEAPGRVIRPRLRMPLGSKLSRTRSLKAATPALAGWNTSTCRLTPSGARSSVA
jgi:hypothetical protein